MRIVEYAATHRSVLRSKQAQARYDRILLLLREGYQTPAELEKVLGEPARQIGATLRRMKARGLVRLVYRWEVCPPSCEKKNTEHEE